MTAEFELVLGLPHTNRSGLAEHLLLAHAGHLQWMALAQAIGTPLSSLRTIQGGDVYATFFFIEEYFPADRPISAFKLDDRLRFAVTLRAFKNIAVEGTLAFDLADRFDSTVTAGLHPKIRFGNIFVNPVKGNSQLKVAPPSNADFSRLTLLPNDENPYHLTRAAEQTGALELLDERWIAVVDDRSTEYRYQIDPDRDTNGAGLVYFANYVAYMDAAERQALARVADSMLPHVSARALVARRIAYYGNVDVDDAVRVEVRLFREGGRTARIGMRFFIRRESDGQLICCSEAIKVLRTLPEG